MSALRAGWAALLDLALPLDCPGCGNVGEQPRAGGLCAACAAELAGPARTAWPRPAPPGLPVPYAVAAYDGVVRELVLAHKERGGTGLAGPLGAAVATSVRATLRRSRDRPATVVALVPVPSRRAAVRERGRDATRAMAASAARVLRGEGTVAVVHPVLRMAPTVRDQAGLDAAARAANLGGAVLLRRSAAAALRPPGTQVVLVDDVVTTGASLAAAAAALSAVGVEVRAAALVAATRRRTDPS